MGSPWDFYFGYYERPWVHPEIEQLERMFHADVALAQARLVPHERAQAEPDTWGAWHREGRHRRLGLGRVVMDNRALLGGIALGAVVALMFDPAAGRRRRALVRDRIVHGSRAARDGLDATLRDLANRARGMVASMRRRFEPDGVDDARLLERVRARLGRVCSHPRAIDVGVSGGRVVLRGPILAREVEDVLMAVGGVRGVESVVNQLEAHDSADGVPSLQGEGRVAGPTLDILQDMWAPATHALVGLAALAAGGLALACTRR